VLLVVVEDTLDRLDTWVIIALVILACTLFVPVEDLAANISAWVRYWVATMAYATDERRDQGNTSFCACYGLAKAKEEREVAVNAVVPL
jgi:hypothetical protein